MDPDRTEIDVGAPLQKHLSIYCMLDVCWVGFKILSVSIEAKIPIQSNPQMDGRRNGQAIYLSSP